MSTILTTCPCGPRVRRNDGVDPDATLPWLWDLLDCCGESLDGGEAETEDEAWEQAHQTSGHHRQHQRRAGGRLRRVRRDGRGAVGDAVGACGAVRLLPGRWMQEGAMRALTLKPHLAEVLDVLWGAMTPEERVRAERSMPASIAEVEDAN